MILNCESHAKYIMAHCGANSEIVYISWLSNRSKRNNGKVECYADMEEQR